MYGAKAIVDLFSRANYSSMGGRGLVMKGVNVFLSQIEENFDKIFSFHCGEDYLLCCRLSERM